MKSMDFEILAMLECETSFEGTAFLVTSSVSGSVWKLDALNKGKIYEIMVDRAIFKKAAEEKEKLQVARELENNGKASKATQQARKQEAVQARQ